MPSKNKTTIDYSNTSNSNFLRFNFLLNSKSDEAGEVDTADSIGYTAVEHSQAGCRLLTVEHYKPQLYAQTLHGTCPSDMTAYTPYALSLLGESTSYPSYNINPSWMLLEV
nr:hypothetical protein [Tanacetum cinerariifolium]